MKKTRQFLLCITLICSSISAETPPKIFEEVRTGNTQAIKNRINNSEDLSEKNSDGNTVLHVAAEQGHTEIVDALTTEPDYSGWGSWLYGCVWEVKLPNKNTKNNNGKTALHNAIENNHINTTEKLLTKNVDTTVIDDENLTPIFAAAKKDNPDFLPLFLKYKLIEQRINGENMLHYSIRNKKLTMITNLAQNKNLVYQENGGGYTPAMLAATQSDATTLKLLKENAFNGWNRAGQQPIHAAAYASTTETAKYLLENGAFIDATDNEGNTPLLHSVMAGNKSGMEFFLAYKANPKKTNAKGKGIIALAVENKRHEILKRLKDHPDVNINERDNEGRTAFMNATITHNHSMMKDLIECGVDTQITDNKGENAFHKVAQTGDLDGFAIVAKNNLDLIDKINIDGESPLFAAVHNGHLKMVKTFIYHNASLQRTNKNGETIFHRAAQCKNKELLAEIMNNNLTKTNINAPAVNGLSPIHYAAANDNIETMQEFTKHGASYTDCTKNGNTLAHTAADYGSVNAIRYLKKQMPVMLQHRNKDNHTPFIIAAQQGKADVVNLIFCENDIMNGDIKTAINLAHQNKHHQIVADLKKAIDIRTEKRVKLSQEPQNIRQVENQIKKLYADLTAENPWYFVSYAFYQSADLRHYSVNDLLDKTEAQCEQISLEYTRQLNKALQEKGKLEQEYNTVILAKAAEQIRLEVQRAAEQNRAQAEQNKRILEQQQRKEAEERRRFAAEQEAELKKLNEQNAELKMLKEQQDELKKIKEQKEELDRIAKQKQIDDAKKAADAQKTQVNPVAAQKAEFDYYAHQKAKDDAEKARQEKHTAALEGQHVPVDYLQPSAPQADQCVVCKEPQLARPSTCKKCTTKCADICPKCFNKYGGQCPQCYDLQVHGIEKQKGECVLGMACCIEEKGVTVIPCEDCKKETSSDRICKSCLQAWVDNNKKIGRPHKCPRCTKDTLIDSLLEKILSQQ